MPCLLPHFFVAKLEANDLADKREGGRIFVRIFRYRYCGYEAMCGFIIERFGSKLAGVGIPLVRQLSRNAEG